MKKPVFWLVVLLLALAIWRLPGGGAGLSAADLSPGHEVVMFATEWCGYCAQARRWFESEGVAFVEIDVESSAEAQRLFREAGGRGVPLTFIGDQRLSGFSAEAYGRALERL